jgi:hypothetical protein
VKKSTNAVFVQRHGPYRPGPDQQVSQPTLGDLVAGSVNEAAVGVDPDTRSQTIRWLFTVFLTQGE